MGSPVAAGPSSDCVHPKDTDRQPFVTLGVGGVQLPGREPTCAAIGERQGDALVHNVCRQTPDRMKLDDHRLVCRIDNAAEATRPA